MKPWDKTVMGGMASRFQTTQWSCILSAKTKDETRRKLVLENLIAAYWRPVYCYLRRKGFDNEAAKDLTQDFFSEIVLGRDLIQKADRSKGKFRTLLLVALERYIVSTFRHDGRIMRGGNVNFFDLDASDIDVPGSTPDPNQAFYYGWIVNLLDEVLAEIKEEYCSTQRIGHWEAFRLKVLEPIFNVAKGPSYKAICDNINIKDESKVANMVITVKRRFRTVLMRKLRDLTSSDAEAEEEFLDIFRILSK